ncbi:MAG: hypothetical protein O7G86_10985 [Gammaproteobacteria bacterium]|nr:hypothetical protein [Gammaproteobacteria bacterium]
MPRIARFPTARQDGGGFYRRERKRWMPVVRKILLNGTQIRKDFGWVESNYCKGASQVLE